MVCKRLILIKIIKDYLLENVPTRTPGLSLNVKVRRLLRAPLLPDPFRILLRRGFRIGKFGSAVFFQGSGQSLKALGFQGELRRAVVRPAALQRFYIVVFIFQVSGKGLRPLRRYARGQGQTAGRGQHHCKKDSFPGFQDII